MGSVTYGAMCATVLASPVSDSFESVGWIASIDACGPSAASISGWEKTSAGAMAAAGGTLIDIHTSILNVPGSTATGAWLPCDAMADIELLKTRFQYHADWPKKGILFCDVLPVLRDPITFEIRITHIMSHIFTETLPRLAQQGAESRINYVVGLDARGFLLGPVVAQRLGAGFVPVRKQGKLPGACVQATFEKEYGADVFEMQRDALPAGANVLVVDDLIATGGSAAAAGSLVRQLQAKVVEYVFVVSIPFLKGAEKLDAPEYHLVEMD